MIELSNAALKRWGAWTRAMSDGQAGSVIMGYGRGSGGDSSFEDAIAELTDQSVAAMPGTMTATVYALKMKYLSLRSNTEACLNLRIGDTAYKTIVREGQMWVSGYLTSIYMRANCPQELKDYINKMAQMKLPNGSIQRRAYKIVDKTAPGYTLNDGRVEN